MENVFHFCHYGAGDIFISREFVKEFISKIPVNHYYSHGKNYRILADLQIHFTPITDKHRMRSYYYIDGQDLYINHWMGVTSRYVTPANSCSIENAYRMYNDYLKELGLSPLEKSVVDYLPQPDYNYFETNGVRRFLDNIILPFVIIDNCLVQSNQAENFDFTPVIDKLCDDLPDYKFVVTSKISLEKRNLFYTGDITQTSDGFDLNEISYLSKFTKVIIGRSSGPMVFCMTKDNCLDPSKNFLSFTYKPQAAHIVNQKENAIANILWSPYVDNFRVYSAIREVIEEAYG